MIGMNNRQSDESTFGRTGGMESEQSRNGFTGEASFRHMTQIDQMMNQPDKEIQNRQGAGRVKPHRPGAGYWRRRMREQQQHAHDEQPQQAYQTKQAQGFWGSCTNQSRQESSVAATPTDSSVSPVHSSLPTSLQNYSLPLEQQVQQQLCNPLSQQVRPHSRRFPQHSKQRLSHVQACGSSNQQQSHLPPSHQHARPNHQHACPNHQHARPNQQQTRRVFNGMKSRPNRHPCPPVSAEPFPSITCTSTVSNQLGFRDQRVKDPQASIDVIPTKTCDSVSPSDNLCTDLIPTLEDPNMIVEVNRLKLLYSSLVIEGSSSNASSDCTRSAGKVVASLCVPDDCPKSLNLRISLIPSDPDFDREKLLPDGLNVRIKYFYERASKDDGLNKSRIGNGISTTEKEETQNHSDASGTPSHPGLQLTSSIDVLNRGFSLLVSETFKAIYNRALSECGRSSYQALKHLDRALVQVFDFFRKEEPVAFAQYCRQFGPIEWTSDEQQKLEEGLIWYGRIVDAKMKWSKIATFVGNGRTARECGERYKTCREVILQKRNESSEEKVPCQIEEPTAGMHATGMQATEEGTSTIAADVLVPSLDANKAATCQDEVELTNLELKNINLIHLEELRILVSCDRCNTQMETTVKSPVSTSQSNSARRHKSHDENGSDEENWESDDDADGIQGVIRPIVSKLRCSKCTSTIHLQFLAKIAFTTSPIIATLNIIGASVSDFLPSGYFIQCSQCSRILLCRNVFSNKERVMHCRRCHVELRLLIGSILCSGKEVKRIADCRVIPKRIRDPHSYKLGTPLPNSGACQHYKKSYRWLRFPCCGRAFPCDVCHDLISDHPCEWATQMICGKCSKEQAYSQRLCACGASPTAAFSSHWEGGTGCRDGVRMSRKDDKKYKLLNKKKHKKD